MPNKLILDYKYISIHLFNSVFHYLIYLQISKYIYISFGIIICYKLVLGKFIIINLYFIKSINHKHYLIKLKKLFRILFNLSSILSFISFLAI